MKKTIFAIAIIGIITLTSAFTIPTVDKLVSKTGHITFFSHTAIEDISADNYKVVSTLDISTGDIVYSVTMQSFEFEKALMQKHYNSSNFLDTKKYPKSKFVGKIANLSDVNFEVDGNYNATVDGELTMHGVTKPISEKIAITVAGESITVIAKMNITLADYNINFIKGKPSTNIAKTIEVTSKSIYTK
jgi:polyisoprenoid-binding protein YceI